MPYSTGIMNKRVTIRIPGAATQDEWGVATGEKKEITVWAAADWSRGTSALRQGAVDAYDIVVFRMRYNAQITRDSILALDGIDYRINSIHRDKKANTIQITATELQKCQG